MNPAITTECPRPEKPVQGTCTHARLFGMNPQGTSSDLWIEQFYTWMKDRGELKAAR